ncbi:hypothetical protein A4A49_08287 [Nicotiana attenuata]|uniref:Uncharacterized protein n=1 Tax=Nicotiana attenuata TaxID=49451 RepID=A0A1J6IR92_NICAT|nr:hypothetical protein A4A49_08287 [Nicotiana attenuata]
MFSINDTKSPGPDGYESGFYKAAWVLEVVNHFSAVSGLVANMEKSNIYLAGMDEATKLTIVRDTGFSVGTLPMRYLGLPLTSKKWSKVECHQLVEKITTNIQSGYAKLLSYAGRLQVINAVLFAIYNFWGAVFILPQSVIRAIDRKCMEYLWGTTEGHRKMALVSWEDNKDFLCKKLLHAISPKLVKTSGWFLLKTKDAMIKLAVLLSFFENSVDQGTVCLSYAAA